MMREYFYLQKSDRRVALTLIAVIAIALGVIFMTGGRNDETNALTAADTTQAVSRKKPNYDTVSRRTYEHRTYERTRIVYRDRPAADRSYNNRSNRDTSTRQRYPVKIRETAHIALNGADTVSLMTVPGIGPYYARQIVRYRNRLGGFVSVSQLDEIEEFPSASMKYFVVGDSSVRKLNVNQLSLSELRRHPYINYYQAKAITDYRRLHGPLQSLNDLSLSKDFPAEAILRLKPYVTF